MIEKKREPPHNMNVGLNQRSRGGDDWEEKPKKENKRRKKKRRK